MENPKGTPVSGLNIVGSKLKLLTKLVLLFIPTVYLFFNCCMFKS